MLGYGLGGRECVCCVCRGGGSVARAPPARHRLCITRRWAMAGKYLHFSLSSCLPSKLRNCPSVCVLLTELTLSVPYRAGSSFSAYFLVRTVFFSYNKLVKTVFRLVHFVKKISRNNKSCSTCRRVCSIGLDGYSSRWISPALIGDVAGFELRSLAYREF